MNAEILYAEVKRAFPSLDNKKVHAFCKGLWSQILKWKKNELSQALAELRSELTIKPADDIEGFEGYTPEERSAKVGLLLDYKLHTKEITASELREFKDIFNLKAQDQDITIEQVSYADIDPDNADIIKAVNWQIEAFNAD
jgi:hypothetical protein